MKRYLWMGFVVLSVGLEAADNPFDLKQNLQSLDKSENFILNELEQVYKIKSKKIEPQVVPETEGTEMEEIRNIVSESQSSETKSEVTEEQKTSVAESDNDDMAGVEENEIANVISDVVSDVMVEEKDISEVKETSVPEAKLSQTEKRKKEIKPDPETETTESDETIAPAIKQPVLEEATKSSQVNEESQITETKGSGLTAKEIEEIYQAALKEAEGK